MAGPSQHIVVWGNCDTGKPRVRILLDALSREFPELSICTRNPWRGIEDKTELKSALRRLRLALGFLVAYPILLLRYLVLPRHTVVVVLYLGTLDVLLLWPLAKLRGARICWDMFVGSYDAVVLDRRLVDPDGIAARIVYGFEWLATRCADRILMDTSVHAEFVEKLFNLGEGSVRSVWVGAETELFRRVPPLIPDPGAPVKVLFYGQFIPLHGLPVLIDAIERIERVDEGNIRFTIIGQGQEARRIDRLIADKNLRTVRRETWVPYHQLPAIIASHHICLGVFAPDGKALRVIPNKVFQILAVGRPLVTANSSAVREILKPGPVLRLCRPGDPQDLAQNIIALARLLQSSACYTEASFPDVSLSAIRTQLREALEDLIAG